MTPHPSPPSKNLATGAAPFVVALVLVFALGLAFWLYTQPDLVVMLAEQLWACF
jgi:hypothetical protein